MRAVVEAATARSQLHDSMTDRGGAPRDIVRVVVAQRRFDGRQASQLGALRLSRQEAGAGAAITPAVPRAFSLRWGLSGPMVFA